jgi:hypothetical protein
MGGARLLSANYRHPEGAKKTAHRPEDVLRNLDGEITCRNGKLFGNAPFFGFNKYPVVIRKDFDPGLARLVVGSPAGIFKVVYDEVFLPKDFYLRFADFGGVVVRNGRHNRNVKKLLRLWPFSGT